MASTVWQVGCAAAALGAGVFLVDRALLWMERRGWVYYRRRKGLSSIGADFLQEVSPGAQAAKRGLEQERVRKNVRPAEEPPSMWTWTRAWCVSAGPGRVRNGPADAHGT